MNSSRSTQALSTDAKRPSKRRRTSRIGYEALRYGIVIGFAIFTGIGLFAFGYGNGVAYLSDDPLTCAQCHIMQDHYDSWLASSHSGVAVCNDCHLPHDNQIAKWISKADNGFFHSLAFTTGDFHEPIQIKSRNRRITQAACLHCHQDFVHHLVETTPATNCVHCHSDVGHRHRR